MSRKLIVLVCALSLFVAAAALAQDAAPAANGPTPVVDRGIVLPKGTGEVGLDIYMGLSTGAVFKRIGADSGDPAERYRGISFKYAIIDNLELGLATQMIYDNSDLAKLMGTDGFKWGGAKIYGKYGFLPFLGAELGIVLPGEKFGDYRLSLDVGIPFKYAILPGLLAVHVRPDLIIGFADKKVAAGESVQLAIYTDLGVTFNATEALFFDVTAAIAKSLMPDAPEAIPFGITAGYTVIPPLDLALNFAFTDLKNAKADGRVLTLSGRFRF